MPSVRVHMSKRLLRRVRGYIELNQLDTEACLDVAVASHCGLPAVTTVTKVRPVCRLRMPPETLRKAREYAVREHLSLGRVLEDSLKEWLESKIGPEDDEMIFDQAVQAFEHGDDTPPVEPGADVTEGSFAYIAERAAEADRHHICLRPECGHRWKSRLEHPRICPKCKSQRWNEGGMTPKSSAESGVAASPLPVTNVDHNCEECGGPIAGGAPGPLCDDCINKLNEENQ
jgi:hypothetical protein